MSSQFIQSLFRKVCVIGTTTLLLTGCGENFQGTFTGKARFNTFSGNNAVGCSAFRASPTQDYDIVAFVQISGSEIAILLTDIQPEESIFNGNVFRTQTALSGKLKSDTKFDFNHYVDDDKLEGYSVSGEITPTRDAISNLSIVYFNDDTSRNGNCAQLNMTGGTLELKK